MQKLKLRPEMTKKQENDKGRYKLLEAQQAELGQVTKHRSYSTIRRNDVSP
jgi:hypothetical protein